MAAFIIEGGHRLSGSIQPQGAKNEALEVICASLLSPSEVIIDNIPDIRDVNNLILLLKDIGVAVRKLGHPNILSALIMSISTISIAMSLCRNVLLSEVVC